MKTSRSAKKVISYQEPCSFADPLSRHDTLIGAFYRTNLNRDICKAIELGKLFIMPIDMEFAYHRGSSPVSFVSACLGHHEKMKDDSGMPDFSSPRVLSAKYRISLRNDMEDTDTEININVDIPSRFLNYVVCEPIGTQTNIRFIYTDKQFTTWVNQTRDTIYDREIQNQKAIVQTHIDWINILGKMKAGKILPGTQQPF